MRLLTLLAAPAAAAAALLAAVTPAAAATPRPLVSPASKQVTRADFNSGPLPSGCGTYSGPYPSQNVSYYSSQQVQVGGGYLHLGVARKVSGDRLYASGGLGCWGLARSYGRFDVRAKAPAGKGINSRITLWPNTGGTQSSVAIELVTAGPESAHLTVGDGKYADRKKISGAFSDRFHLFTIEWTPKNTRLLLDGQPIYTTSRTYPGKRWLGIAVSAGDSLTGLPDDSALPVEFLIDWFMISSYTPGAAMASPTPAATTPPASPTRSAAPATATSPETTFAVPAAASSDESSSPGPWRGVAVLLAIMAIAVGLWQWDQIRARRRRVAVVEAFPPEPLVPPRPAPRVPEPESIPIRGTRLPRPPQTTPRPSRPA